MFDAIDPANPVVALCAEGMTMEGTPGAARALFERAWEARSDDNDAAIAAHFLARHQRRAWGLGREPWLIEGLATFADGRCQGSTIRAVGRDLLARRRSVIANDLLASFERLRRSDRAAAYVLVGTFVDYLWAERGREGVRRIWQGRDTVSDVAVLPGLGGGLTAGWRAYVSRVAGASAGLDSGAFQRLGCG